MLKLVNEKVSKTFENGMKHCKFSFLGIMLCDGFNLLSQAKHSNSLTFRILIVLRFFSAKPANSTVFRMCTLLAFRSAISSISTAIRIPIYLVTEIFSAKSTIFRRLPRLYMPQGYALNCLVCISVCERFKSY